MFGLLGKITNKRSKILVYKWGSPTYIFSDNHCKGEKGDLALEALLGILLETFDIDFLGELAYAHNCKNCKFKDIPNLNFIDKTNEVSLRKLNANSYDLCIVFLGKDNIQFNNFFVGYAMKHKLKLIGVSTDARYLTINAPLPLHHVYTSVLESKFIYNKIYQQTTEVHSCKIGYEIAKYNIDKHYKVLKGDDKIDFIKGDILIGANQKKQTLPESKMNKILTFCWFNRDREITLFGKWDIKELEIGGILEKIPCNLRILNLQLGYNQYLNSLGNFKEIVIIHNENYTEFTKVINYNDNFVPIRVMEAVILGLSYRFYDSIITFRSVKSLIECSPSLTEVVKYHIKRG